MQTPDSADILLVEDNLNDAKLTTLALKENNFTNKIVHVEDGAEALEYIFATGKFSDRKVENLPIVILLDLKMPKVDGLEVLRKIKADERTKKIPVVVFTSSDGDPDIKESYNLGANSYIIKPMEFDMFQKAVKEAGLYWVLLNKPPRA
jgi:two-component system response regulator